MGVKNLWDILESCKKKLPLHHLQNKRVCVDLSCWMVQLQSVNRSHCALKDKVYLKGLFHRIRALIALNCSLIFVTDGSIPAIKSSAYRRRLNAGNEVLTDAGDPCKISAIKRNMGSEFSCMIKEAKFLGGALGIPCLDGIEEGEAQCALLNAESLCDGCFTSDSDAFLFGARTVYRDICLGEGGYVVCYEMDDIERKLGFGRNSLITLAVLLGSDYNQGVRGIGPESACQLVKSIGDAAVLQRLVSEGLSIAKKPKSSKKKCQIVTCDNKENNPEYMKDCNGGKCPTDKQFLEVIKAYLKPKCHLADSDPVKRVLPVYPFSRSQLHQICSQFFDWPPEKTDEYILPKIAERDLRRFANLRSTSSRLSFNIPIYEIPVKCPVSGIIKPRKIQGIDYFEVSWENVNGLETSPVPADLVESACPEKILEFKERKDQEQKQKRTRKPRPTVKANKSAELKEIDNKLNELLLDIERENTASTNAVVLQRLSPETAGTITKLKRLDQKTTTSSSTESKGSDRVVEEINVKGRSYVTSSTSIRTEFVDLLSPSPAAHARGVSKFREAKSIEVIELSESEGEVSPEHARKARELRLFIANIRNETY